MQRQGCTRTARPRPSCAVLKYRLIFLLSLLYQRRGQCKNRNLPALGFRPNLQYPGYPIAGWRLFWASENGIKIREALSLSLSHSVLASKEMLRDFDSALTRLKQSPQLCPQGFRPDQWRKMAMTSSPVLSPYPNQG
ncbi:uncharacterized protein ARMOST_13891 [Armillaria ostoyae]|uniref:Uncharacterized protein n=1 Tax=Armillaria ostoyae TaxID=47428 RepID=A0A284RP68_ARMOS|nr:uncharacterized protein ARMOST_13891 [Armillaria ostoyae]